jgi:hypothetical protein
MNDDEYTEDELDLLADIVRFLRQHRRERLMNKITRREQYRAYLRGWHGREPTDAEIDGGLAEMDAMSEDEKQAWRKVAKTTADLREYFRKKDAGEL